MITVKEVVAKFDAEGSPIGGIWKGVIRQTDSYVTRLIIDLSDISGNIINVGINVKKADDSTNQEIGLITCPPVPNAVKTYYCDISNWYTNIPGNLEITVAALGNMHGLTQWFNMSKIKFTIEGTAYPLDETVEPEIYNVISVNGRTGVVVLPLDGIKVNGEVLEPDEEYKVNIEVPTKTSELENDSTFQTLNDANDLKNVIEAKIGTTFLGDFESDTDALNSIIGKASGLYAFTTANGAYTFFVRHRNFGNSGGYWNGAIEWSQDGFGFTRIYYENSVLQEETRYDFDTLNEIVGRIASHNTSETAHTDIRLSIDTVRALAEGRVKARSFATYEDLEDFIETTEEELNVGDTFFIEDTNVPDYWWSSNGLKELEVNKVFLENYYTKEQTDLLLSEKLSSVPQATEFEFGGIKAKARTTENLEVAIDEESGKGFVPTPYQVPDSNQTRSVITFDFQSGENLLATDIVMLATDRKWYKPNTVAAVNFLPNALVGRVLQNVTPNQSIGIHTEGLRTVNNISGDKTVGEMIYLQGTIVNDFFVNDNILTTVLLPNKSYKLVGIYHSGGYIYFIDDHYCISLDANSKISTFNGREFTVPSFVSESGISRADRVHSSVFTAGENLAFSDIVVLGKDRKWRKITNTTPFDPKTNIGHCVTSYSNGSSNPDIRTRGSLQVNSSYFDVNVEGEAVYLRGDLVDGLFVSEGIVTTSLTPNKSYIYLGISNGSNFIYFTSNKHCFTLDTDSRITHINGTALTIPQYVPEAFLAYSLRHDTNNQVGQTLTKLKMCMQGIDGKYYPFSIGDTSSGTKVPNTVPFLINGQILFNNSNSTINSNGTFRGSSRNAGNISSAIRYTLNDTIFTAFKSIYIIFNVGADGHLYLVDGGVASSTEWYTQTLPTIEDGKVYLHLGFMINTTDLFLSINHPIYEFKNGAIRPYQVPNEVVLFEGAATTAELPHPLDTFDTLEIMVTSMDYLPYAPNHKIFVNSTQMGILKNAVDDEGISIQNNINLYGELGFATIVLDIRYYTDPNRYIVSFNNSSPICKIIKFDSTTGEPTVIALPSGLKIIEVVGKRRG